MGLARVLAVVLFFALLHNPVQAVQSVALAWDPNPDPTVVGYKMYWGVASSTYTNMVDAGNAMSVSIPGLVEGTTYFFAATSYDTFGLESDWSNEVSYTVRLPTVQIHAETEGQFILTLTGALGHTYDIEATEDFTAWTVIGTATLGSSGSLDSTDTNAASFPKRFYRARDTQP